MHVVDSASPDALGLVRPPPVDVERGAFVALDYHYCGFSGRRGGCRGGEWNGRRVTPWSNVREVRARRGTSSSGSPFVLAGALLVGAFGAGVLISSVQSDYPAVRVAGALGGAGGLVLSGAFLKMFLDGNSERVLDRAP
jgi:hypothetical protein